MFIPVFANYLFEVGQIKKEQFGMILNYSKDERLLLGQLASNIGLMSPEQILEVKRLQASSDKMFGQIALEAEYLTEDELNLLLKMQSKNDLVVIKILTEHNILELANILEQFEGFKEYYSLSEADYEAIVANNIRRCLERVSKITDEYGTFIDFADLFVKMVVRFLDRECLPKKIERVDSLTCECAIVQQCTGDKEMTLGYTASRETLLSIADSYASMQFTTLAGTAVDALKDFMKCSTGIFNTEMNQVKDTKIVLDAPEFESNKTFNDLYILPIETLFGEVKIFFSK